MSLFEPEFLVKLGKIIVADILLAGDNALVIALATRGLPAKQQFFGRMFGAGGAVLLRILFIVIIGYLLQVPYLQLAGGLLLLWIALKLVRPQEEALHEAAQHEEGGHARVAGTLREAITVIIVADITMSFDNVVAIANIAKDPNTGNLDIPLVVFGLLFSIPLVVWGSTLISRLMERFRWIVWLGGGVLAHVASSIIFHDHKVLGWMGIQPGQLPIDGSAVWWTTHVTPWVLAVLLFAYGMWSASVAAADRGEQKPA